MTQDDGGYELQPLPEGNEKGGSPPADSAGAVSAGGARPKPGEPGWVPPVPIIEKAEEGAVTAEEIAAAEAAADIERHKITAALGYLFFVIPLLVAPNSKFTRYHANQGLLLFILLFVVVVLVSLVQGMSWGVERVLEGRIELLATFFSCGFGLLELALLAGWVALLITGTLHAMNGLKEPLPVIGHWTLIHEHDSLAGGVPSAASEKITSVQMQEEKKS